MTAPSSLAEEAIDTMQRAKAEIVRLRGTNEELVEALRHAVAIIEMHVDRDALGAGGDPRTGQWPLLDEYLHHMRTVIAKARGK